MNNLAWILCEHDGQPQEAARLASGLVADGASNPDYACLLDTWGVIQYRLAMIESKAGRKQKAAQFLAESSSQLEECIRRAPDALTKSQATLHWARTLAEIDTARALRVLKALLDDKEAMALLAAEERADAERLLRQLGSAPPLDQSAHRSVMIEERLVLSPD
jgi:hypothetical protein